MKVCFVAGTLGRGGAERQLIYMLRALAEEGVATKLLCLTSGEALEREVADLGVEIEWVGSSPRRIARLGNIVRAVRASRADVVQSAHFYTNIYAAAAGRLAGIPSIGAIRNDLISEIGADAIFGKWQFKTPGRLIANSAIAIKNAESMGRDAELVRNVVEVKAAAGRTATDARSAVRVLFAGRLVPQKRPEIFIDLAKRLVGESPGLEVGFDVAGDGPLRVGLEKLATTSGSAGAKINFLGEIGEMSGIYGESDILVLTSAHEGTPNVVLEAMAHGLPVVATRVGGVPDILNADSGIIVDPSDFEGLLDGVRLLVHDRERRVAMGGRGREQVSANHSLGYLRRRLPEIYRRLLSKVNS